MASPTPAAPLFSRAYRGWLLAMLVITNAFNLADRQNMAVSLQAIKLDLKFTDSEMGWLQGLGFAALYTIMGLPIARLAEHVSRIRVIAACLAVFGVSAALCGVSTGFWTLLAFRAAVAIGDAGFGPPVSSLIGDHYPMGKRASAMSILWLGAPLGVLFGVNFGGWMAEHSSWRYSFNSIGIAAVIFSLVVLFSLREPPRGMSDPAGLVTSKPPPVITAAGFLFSKPSVVLLLLGCLFAAIAMNGIGQWLAAFLARNYHVGYAAAGRLLGQIAVAAMASGLVIGGFGVDWGGRFDKRWYVWGPAIGIGLAAPLFYLGFNQSTLVATGVTLMAAHICMFVYYTPTFAMAQNMVGAEMRASSAFFVSLMQGLGIAIGPTLVGLLSDAFTERVFAGGAYRTVCPGGAAPRGATEALAQACSQASAVGLKYTLMTVSLLCLVSALFYLLASRWLRADLEKRYVPDETQSPAAAPASARADLT
jgi:predicted MFS family arabinose efflux permease